MGKHTLNVIEDMSLRDGYRYEQDMTAQIGKTDDAKEAQRAFAEKRAGFHRTLIGGVSFGSTFEGVARIARQTAGDRKCNKSGHKVPGGIVESRQVGHGWT